MNTSYAILNAVTGQMNHVKIGGARVHAWVFLSECFASTDSVESLFAVVAGRNVRQMRRGLGIKRAEGAPVFPGHTDPKRAADRARAAKCAYLYTWTGAAWRVESL